MNESNDYIYPYPITSILPHFPIRFNDRMERRRSSGFSVTVKTVGLTGFYLARFKDKTSGFFETYKSRTQSNACSRAEIGNGSSEIACILCVL